MHGFNIFKAVLVAALVTYKVRCITNYLCILYKIKINGAEIIITKITKIEMSICLLLSDYIILFTFNTRLPEQL